MISIFLQNILSLKFQIILEEELKLVGVSTLICSLLIGLKHYFFCSIFFSVPRNILPLFVLTSSCISIIAHLPRRSINFDMLVTNRIKALLSLFDIFSIPRNILPLFVLTSSCISNSWTPFCA